MFMYSRTHFFVYVQENEYDEVNEAVQEAVHGVSDVVLDTVSLPFRSEGTKNKIFLLLLIFSVAI